MQSAALHGDADVGTFETSPEWQNGEVSKTCGERQAPVNLTFFKTGAPLAINYLTSGVAVHSTNNSGRGGARNRADRESNALSASKIGDLMAAERHARTIGLPFTRMITIHWEAAGVPLVEMAKATGLFIDLMAKTLARHGKQTAWLWVHENAQGNGHDKGGHCHLLVHIPAHLVPVIISRQLGWLNRITGQPYRARVIRSKPIGGRLGLERGNPELHGINLQAALAYVLKGASSDAASQFVLRQLEPGGRIIGKRCGKSQNIAQSARRAWINSKF